ncbi:MAG: response regulator transcription factor [Bacteroidaceae bacterium]|jgi:DNA-binding NarL/FixJ family response regulator|nr:response regulator transcription factor [Bacteroidaceae bacterium]
MEKEIAIIDNNSLARLGLQSLLEEIIPDFTIRTFGSFAELMADTPDMFVHYFVSTQIYLEHTTFFLQKKNQTVVLCNAETQAQLSGVLSLNINQDEQHLVKSILLLHQHGHRKGHPHSLPTGMHPAIHPQMPLQNDLTKREIEVLSLVARGFINKEIANKLNISLTTVITHRKNITEKLGIKSVSGLTIYAVMRGYVEADSI